MSRDPSDAVSRETDQRSPATRLGRAVLDVVAARHRRRDRHDVGTNWLYDVILGGQDGLVNILGIILGVIAGGGSKAVLLATGFAAGITESISMGAVGYTSARSQRDYYRAQRAREETHVSTEPDLEREEVCDIYARMGFEGELLDRVVDTITANRDTWIGTIMDQELHLSPVEAPTILRSAVIITVATLIGHLIPLLPFVWLARQPALITAVVLAAVVLFAVGVYSAVTLVGDWRRNGVQMVVIGLGAAAVGFAVGRLFGASG
ncbi:MAG TPA: VIT1/CCC1 transporter family protein [Candidatus Dormibacteraeota bacterium]|nr:VIT1/CCC1 transporter family protein [Candidatus Dormibacteraeota bacterium]